MNQEVIDSIKGERVGFGSRASYIKGFVLSLALTLLAYLLVHTHLAHHHQFPPDAFMGIALPVLAVIQLIVQLVFFLHVHKESKPRWNLVVMLFAALVVLIIVIGSLWIMYHLNYNMTPQQQNYYLLQQDGGL